MSNLVLSGNYKIIEMGTTRAKVFEDFKKGDIIEISIELDKEKDMEKSQRLSIYINDKKTYISTLSRAIECGLELKKTRINGGTLENKEIVKELKSTANSRSMKIFELRKKNKSLEGEMLYYKDTVKYMRITLRKLLSEVLSEGLLDYAGEIQYILKEGEKKDYGYSEEQHEGD